MTWSRMHCTHDNNVEDLIMNKMSISRLMPLILLVATLVSCSGGGGGGGDGITITQPTTAVVTFATTTSSAIPANTTINAYDVTISLPAGVTVKSTTNPPQTDSGVVTATGAAAGSYIFAVYSAATSTEAGKVHIIVAKPDGFSAGEFSTVNCDIAAGYYPKPSDFPQPTFTASGFDTTSTTIDLTSYMSLTATAVIN
jgi:hypothetical protein